MADEMVSLEAEQARANELLSGVGGPYVSLSVAAAIAFHQAHGNTRAIVTRQDYDDALNIAAAALSRLIPIYERKDAPEGREALVIDLARQRFARGATQMRVREQIIARELSIRVADLQAALALIKSAGLPFSFAFSQSEAPQEDPVRSAE